MSSEMKLPPCGRFVTTHDANGSSIHLKQRPLLPFNIARVGQMARSYSVQGAPVVLEGEADVRAFQDGEGECNQKRRDIVVPEGVNLNVLDLQPGGVTDFHQTVSIDFSVCTIGSIDHELDSGEVVHLNPGDHIVQRGTMHRWINPSKTHPARLVATSISCAPFPVPGQGRPLREVHIRRNNEEIRSKM